MDRSVLGQRYGLAKRPLIVESKRPVRASWIVVASGLLLASTACATASPQADRGQPTALSRDSHPAAGTIEPSGRPSGSKASTSPPSDINLGTSCVRPKLRLKLGESIDEATGQGTLLVAVINRSHHPCHLKGYPAIELLDRDYQRLAFDYRHGGDIMLRDVRPRMVTIRPDTDAYFAINKYRCDLAGEVAVSRMRVRLPGLRIRLGLDLPRHTGFAGYCGPNDPGSIVDISPVATVAVTLHR
jgi:hypothetical protein